MGANPSGCAGLKLRAGLDWCSSAIIFAAEVPRMTTCPKCSRPVDVARESYRAELNHRECPSERDRAQAAHRANVKTRRSAEGRAV